MPHSQFFIRCIKACAWTYLYGYLPFTDSGFMKSSQQSTVLPINKNESEHPLVVCGLA